MRLNCIICDLCRKEMENRENWIKFRLKKGWVDWDGVKGWEGRIVHICPQCQDKLKIYWREHNWKD